MVCVSCMIAPEMQVPPSGTLHIGERMLRKSVTIQTLVPDVQVLGPSTSVETLGRADRSAAKDPVPDGLSPSLGVRVGMGGWGRISKHKKRRHDVAEEWARLAERDRALDAREARLFAREAAQEARKQKERDILVAAEARDDLADARDADAERRDREADLRSFLHDQAYGEDYIQARRFAALDRAESRSDREWSARDRSELTGHDARPLFDDRPAD